MNFPYRVSEKQVLLIEKTII
uniref:Uncharacterized protein n=1 Tax=Anguilla anguilla TaxID=7936 RepID=A0A0E9VH79_ANGAN